jgi:transcription initiation factor TFIIH subunit 1
MATVKGSAAYKKKDGTLTVSKDQNTILWTPVAPRGAPPGITIAVSEITSMSKGVFVVG